jgi:hypothetical protein
MLASFPTLSSHPQPETRASTAQAASQTIFRPIQLTVAHAQLYVTHAWGKAGGRRHTNHTRVLVRHTGRNSLARAARLATSLGGPQQQPHKRTKAPGGRDAQRSPVEVTAVGIYM